METLSSQLYNYLCEVVGSEQTVSARRWFFKIFDDCCNTILADGNTRYRCQISSGSKAEGLDFSGSDLDVMFVLNIQVYGSHGNTNSNSHLLCYDMEYSQPGYCKIKICPSQINDGHSYILNSFGSYFPFITAIHSGSEIIISCEKFKQFFLTLETKKLNASKLHGPCITSNNDELDKAFCFHCPVWPSEASRWIGRNRTSCWPSVSIVSKIVQEGILFVPVGGIDEESSCEWRISFSVGEKLLIHSLNHTQLLCYSLLKFMLKEIINNIPDLQNLLCSYFMKTVLFWILEELEARVWTQENLLVCFQHCLKRLVYFVDCGYCPNYFMPENNMFRNKIYGDRQRHLGSFLRDLYAGGILNVVMRCTSLCGFLNMTTRITSTEEEIDRGIYPLLTFIFRYSFLEHLPVEFVSKILKRMHFLRRRIPKFASGLYMINFIHLVLKFLSCQFCYNDQLCNRQLYIDLKICRCLLLMRTGWDVSDWLFLAMFFYSHRQFCNALTITEFIRSECTENRVFNSVNDKLKTSSTHEKLEQLSFGRRYKIAYVHDIMLGCDRRNSFANLFYRELCFSKHLVRVLSKGTFSILMPCMFGVSGDLEYKKYLEIFMDFDPLKLNKKIVHDVWNTVFPTSLVHYIRFMCYHHFGNHDARQHSLYDLKATVDQLYHENTNYLNLCSSCALLERAIEVSGSDIDTTPYAKKVWRLIFSKLNNDV